MSTLSSSLDFINKEIEITDFDKVKKPLIIGISGPQGSGKSYLVNLLQTELQKQHEKLNIVKFLIDDYYLTFLEQQKVTVEAEKSGNRLLNGRGLPGTHDLELINQTFEKILSAEETEVKIPSYDKFCYDGSGDRGEWITVKLPIHVILFEGWFLGYESFDDDLIRLNYLRAGPFSQIQNYRLYEIEQLNENLKLYQNIWKHLSKFIIFSTSDIQSVHKWRLEQEHQLIKEKGQGMSDDQVKEFVDRYMPCYYLYYEHICDEGIVKHENGNLRIEIDDNRKYVKLETFGKTDLVL